jgi:uncharacterized protein
VLVWPDRATVDRQAREWAAGVVAERPELRRLGYFGSYARGDWGVGSDLDLVAVLSSSPLPFPERGASFDLTTLPVPAEILVYTEDEWQKLRQTGGRFAETLAREVIWLL